MSRKVTMRGENTFMVKEIVCSRCGMLYESLDLRVLEGDLDTGNNVCVCVLYIYVCV